MSPLGESLLGQGWYVESEPLIVAGYEGMKAHEAECHEDSDKIPLLNDL